MAQRDSKLRAMSQYKGVLILIMNIIPQTTPGVISEEILLVIDCAIPTIMVQDGICWACFNTIIKAISVVIIQHR